MTNHRLLVTCPLIANSMDRYADRLSDHGIAYDVVEVEQQLSEAELLDMIDPYDAILGGDDELTATVLSHASKLKIVAKWGIGTDNIDSAAAKRNDVAVVNTPGAFSDEVANVVVGYATMLARQLHHVDRNVRQGNWYTPRGRSLAGKTFGVVGVGNIGRAVAKRAHAMGMDVLGNDVVDFEGALPDWVDVTSVGKTELFESSDIVSLHCHLSETTREMVGREELLLLGEGGYLVNTARGGLVDQDALVAALSRGTIAGAALDVYEDEPLPASSPLREMDSVVLGTHNAQNTAEAVKRVNERAIQNVIDALAES